MDIGMWAVDNQGNEHKIKYIRPGLRLKHIVIKMNNKRYKCISLLYGN